MRNTSGQISPFLILVIGVLVLAIGATAMIGEAAFTRIRLANTADGAVVSGAAGLCRTLNQIRLISLGGGGMLVNHVALQAHLLLKRSICPCNGATWLAWRYYGEPLTSGFVINSLLSAYNLNKEAERLGDNAPRDLRISLYESAFGTGIVDEPKPFLDTGGKTVHRTNPRTGQLEAYGDWFDADDEVLNTLDEYRKAQRDGYANAKVEGLNYERYVQRKSNFTLSMLAYKKANQSWWRTDQLSYAYHKSKDRIKSANNRENAACKGVVTTTDPGAVRVCGQDPEAYFSTEFLNVPTKVDVDAQPMVLFYLWIKIIPTYPNGCYCIPLPGFLVNPWAWLRKVEVNHKTFGMNVSKRTPFETVPIYGRRVTQGSSAGVNIRGSVWSGFEPKMSY